MTETTSPVSPVGEEINFLDEKTKKALFGILKSPLARMMLGQAKQKTDGVKVTEISTDAEGIHFTLMDSKIQKERRVKMTKADLEQIIRFVME